MISFGSKMPMGETDGRATPGHEPFCCNLSLMQHSASDNYRIIHVLDHSLPVQSGYSYRTLGIIRGQRDGGWTTIQLTTPRHVVQGPNPEVIDGFAFHRTSWEPGRLAKSIIRDIDQMRCTEGALASLCREFAPTVLHAHSPVLTAYPALRIGRRLNIPVVYEVRALWEDAAVSEGKCWYGGPRYLASRWLETRAMRQAAAVIVICAGLRDEILSRGIPPGKVSIVPNAVDVERLPPLDWRDRELAQRLGLDQGPVLGFIGSFYKYEGLSLLVEALAKITRRFPRAKLLLVGGGPEEGSVRGQVQSMGLGASVIMPGRVPHGDVQRYYSLIDICVYPRLKSRLTDLVTPLKPLESMSQKKLVLASDVGGHRELIQHGETGFLFPAGNSGALAAAVLQLMDQKEDWQRTLQKARRYVEMERTWARVASEYREVYGRLVNEPRSAAGTTPDRYASR